MHGILLCSSYMLLSRVENAVDTATTGTSVINRVKSYN